MAAASRLRPMVAMAVAATAGLVALQREDGAVVESDRGERATALESVRRRIRDFAILSASSSTLTVAAGKADSSIFTFAGKMKGLAFINDPDGYWIEIFDLKRIGLLTAEAS